MSVYQPDHNGECRNCDEWLDAHSEDGTCPTDPGQAEANAERYRATQLVPDRCRVCGKLIGVGLPLFHLGLCDDCRDKAPQ